ncbi:Uncharacterised protein [Mycobacteroides abscessus subsp. abscessus]|nr:Uncharacterised protein [Mycobacteroides abscessus subsp. abscessus]
MTRATRYFTKHINLSRHATKHALSSNLFGDVPHADIDEEK